MRRIPRFPETDNSEARALWRERFAFIVMGITFFALYWFVGGASHS